MRSWPVISALFLFLGAGASAQTIVSETFDTALSGWSFEVGTAEWSSVDSGGLSTSGSAKVTNRLPAGGFEAHISRCVQITPPVSSFVAGARARLGDGPPADGSTQLNILFFTSSDCSGLGSHGINIGLGGTTFWSRNLFSWTYFPSLTDVHSVMVSPTLYKNSPGGEVTAYFDDVLLGINAAATLAHDRFSVGTAWKTGSGQIGIGNPVELTADSAYFWFFAPSNIELLVKVLDACSLNNRYWVFAGGLTNVETFLAVVDTQQSPERTYLNPQGQAFLPIQDTDALPSCP